MINPAISQNPFNNTKAVGRNGPGSGTYVTKSWGQETPSPSGRLNTLIDQIDPDKGFFYFSGAYDTSGYLFQSETDGFSLSELTLTNEGSNAVEYTVNQNNATTGATLESGSSIAFSTQITSLWVGGTATIRAEGPHTYNVDTI